MNDYPRVIVQFPGVMRVVNTEEEFRAICRTEIFGWTVICAVFAVAALGCLSLVFL